MPTADLDLARLQDVLADALTAADPVARLRELAQPGDELLATVDPDGLRLAALLVTKLRFERLMQGSAMAVAWFERDGRGFTAAFRRYHAQVLPEAEDGWGEAAAFEQWCNADAAGDRP